MNVIEVEKIPKDCWLFKSLDDAKKMAEDTEQEDIYHFKCGYSEYWCVPLAYYE